MTKSFIIVLLSLMFFWQTMAIVSSGSDGTYTAVYLPTKKNYGVLIQLEFDVAPAFSADDFSDYSTAFFAPANRGTLKTTLLSMFKIHYIQYLQNLPITNVIYSIFSSPRKFIQIYFACY